MVKKCIEDGCDKVATKRGYCGTHYVLHHRHGDFGIIKCSVDGCGRNAVSLGLCDMHYLRYIRNGSANTKRNYSHGMVHSDEYRIWQGIKNRCYREKTKCFNNYGGRGIIVCDRWINDFMAFYNDVGPRPSNKHEIDRIDVNGNYCPENCRWVLHDINSQNKRNNVLSWDLVHKIRNMHNDGIKNINISSEFGISRSLVSQVIKNQIWRE